MPYPSVTPVAVVTGAGRRIGRCIASRLFNDGFSLCLHYLHSKTEVESLVMEFNKKREGSAMVHQADFSFLEHRRRVFAGEDANAASSALASSLQERCEGLMEACWNHYGRCDVLVNNASTFLPSPLMGRATQHSTVGGEEDTLSKGENKPPPSRKPQDHTEDLAGALLGSNALAPFYLTKAFSHLSVKDSVASGCSGRCVVNIVDSMLDRPLRGFTLYTMAKRALEGLTLSSALELAPYHIRVNAVAPGLSLLPEKGLTTGVKEGDSEDGVVMALRSSIPLGQKEASGENLAGVVSFLVSPEASYITGSIIPVDGGWRLSRRAE